ncbi:Hypothetical predicted protein [Podarcis lilfordi]|uniref:Uncharacterized protein n=1 Tax=Podarcis lilfordi TaxID=74358 RepID=A0AA35L7V1_9SAUR|nr:Hypothetical predicted protein [Podarcis lilfordi]
MGLWQDPGTAMETAHVEPSKQRLNSAFIYSHSIFTGIPENCGSVRLAQGILTENFHRSHQAKDLSVCLMISRHGSERFFFCLVGFPSKVPCLLPNQNKVNLLKTQLAFVPIQQ